MFCPKCGCQVSDEKNFCPRCGFKLPKAENRVDTEPVQEDYDVVDDYDYDQDEYEPPRRKIWPFILIGVAVLVIAAAAAVYFLVLKPHKNPVPAESSQIVQTEVPSAPETIPTESTTEETTTKEAFPKTMYTTAPSGLLLREGPGKKYKAIYLINYGTKISVEKTKGKWAYTTVSGLSGWCHTKYLTEDPSDLEKATTRASGSGNPNQLVEPAIRVDYGYHGYVNTKDGLMFRYGPGQEYNAIDVIPYMTEVEEEGYEGEWIYIKYKGRYGWVNSRYITASGGMAKPAIYLYPTQKMDVSVSIRLSEGTFTRTAPEADGNWLVTAQPDGTLTDKKTGKTYDYIYWESDSEPDYDWSEGYVIEGCETEAFLREILPEMGLNEHEYEEFIAYWLPRMQKNAMNLITFQKNCYTDAAQMDIVPKPDSVLRLFMAYKAVDGPVPVTAPSIEPFTRTGFTVVEWGGAEVQ